MSTMRLDGMYSLYKNMIGSGQGDAITNEELLTMLINAEWDNRENMIGSGQCDAITNKIHKQMKQSRTNRNNQM